MDTPRRLRLLTGVIARIGEAVGATELLHAADGLPADAGIDVCVEPDALWVGADRLTSPTPRLVLGLQPPLDARSLCDALGVDHPVAVTGDVHQARWSVHVAGAELPDPYARRIAVKPFRAGRWDVRLDLLGRPAGPLPDLVAGASPAYDVRERGGQVHRIEVTRGTCRSVVVSAAHPDARALLAATAAAHPVWRGGWGLEPDHAFVLVHDGGRPVTGAAFRVVRPGLAMASRFCVAAEGQIGHAGSVLLDVLESVALERGCDRLRLDSSAFRHDAQVPYLRHGYLVGPPYDGDADQAVWAERDLRPAGARNDPARCHGR